MLKTEIHKDVLIVTIDRFERRNAVDRATAELLVNAFKEFDQNDNLKVAILTGAGGTFCSGADLDAFASGEGNIVEEHGEGPMGPTRMRLNKPVIAAIEGFAVAGGLELALWCDLRVAAHGSTLGVYCRRFGVPLIDLGTIRLPRLIGQSRALDLILTGRGIDVDEALSMGLINRVAKKGQALVESLKIAEQLSSFPQLAMRNDRLSVYEQWDLTETEAIKNELKHGVVSLKSGESKAGAEAFGHGQGRHGNST